MKCAIASIIFASCVVAVSANGWARPAVLAAPVALAATGQSSVFRADDSYGNTKFGYEESHATGGSARQEEIVNGVVRGMYALTDADGRRRVVNYIADEAGFRANIQTNEPGVEPKDPADVLINKNGAAVVAVAAPAPLALPAPAPLALPAPAPLALPAPAPLALPAPLPAPLPRAHYGGLGAPLALPAPAPLALPAPAPLALPSAPIAHPIRAGYGAPRVLAAPIAAPVAAPLVVEAPAPRAFAYSYSSNHAAPVHHAAPLALPLPAPLPAPIAAAPLPAYHQAPLLQQRLNAY